MTHSSSKPPQSGCDSPYCCQKLLGETSHLSTQDQASIDPTQIDPAKLGLSSKAIRFHTSLSILWLISCFFLGMGIAWEARLEEIWVFLSGLTALLVGMILWRWLSKWQAARSG